MGFKEFGEATSQKKTSLKSCPKSFKDSLSKTPAAVDSCMYLKKKTLGVKNGWTFSPGVLFLCWIREVYHTYFFQFLIELCT